MTEAPESEAVLAFIRERQPAVLAEAIRQLSTCSRDELAAVSHAVAGNVGSYQLDEAHAQVTDLRRVVGNPDASPEQIDVAWSETLTVLRALESGLSHE